MKTEVRKELSKGYRKHWIDAFFILKYDETLTDKENIKMFFDWSYSINLEDVKWRFENVC